ncbi:hypothetical protein MTR67_025790 [Solanum verrucosum]|uniref:Uncharacterized protein n=1 Tax=Solanum verrucosum TaxID=315347 RepID=A0AAF0R0V5_SOLVR|nr:hypothetical protein MTR67_025790 [Solanum verrucosum]
MVTFLIQGPMDMGCPQFRQSFSGQGSSNSATPKFNKYRASKPKTQGSCGNVSPIPTYQKCGKNHLRKCLVGTNVSRPKVHLRLDMKYKSPRDPTQAT